MEPPSTTLHEQPALAEIGPYRLLGSLGQGGMAEVFLAEHRHLAQVRAVKLLPATSHAGLVGRLLTEARATARLRHPAIVQVFDCDTLPTGGAFIAMEYLEGEPLGQWLGRAGPLAEWPYLAAAVVGVVADGLAFAHQHEIIHRDIKPENLFLVPEPHDRHRFSVRILDFGVAKLLGEEPLMKTRDGAVIGTPVYMAPEQWRAGAPVDARTDVYSLGCVLFELLVGRPPFSGGDGWEMMHAHLETPAPALLERAPEIPAELAALVADMLAKEPAARPDGMAAVLARLSDFIGLPAARFSEVLRTPAHAPVAGGVGTARETTRQGLNASIARPAPTTPAHVLAPPAVTPTIERRRIPRAVGSAAIVGAVLGSLVALLAFLREEPAAPMTPARAVAPRPPASVPRLAPPVPTAPVAPASTASPAAPAAAEDTVPAPTKIKRATRPPAPRPRPAESDNVYLPVAD